MRSWRSVGGGVALVFLALHAGTGPAAAQSLQWARTYQGAGLEVGSGIARSAGDGSIYAVGVRYPSFPALVAGRGGGVVRKLTGNGKLLWSKSFPFGLAGVAVARDGSVYAAGTRLTTAGDAVAILRKMTPDGSEIWQRDLPSSGGTGASTGQAVVVSPAGTYVWISGSERTASGWDARLAKYTAGGEHVWSGRYHAPTGNECVASGVDLDRDGNVYIAGEAATMSGNTIHESRALVAKFSRSGTLLWARYLPAGADRVDSAYDIAVGPDGSLYVAADRAMGDIDAALWKLSSASGAVLWRKVVDAGDNENFTSVAVRPGGGEVCAAGGLAYLSEAPAAFVRCYSPAGVQLWEGICPSPAPGLAMARGVALAGDGSTYLIGVVTSAGASEFDLWVAKYR